MCLKFVRVSINLGRLLVPLYAVLFPTFLLVDADAGCGKWMPVEYRMCATNLPEPPERERDLVGFNTFLKGGKFYAQRFRSTLPVLDNGCRQGAFFHMQEWKKIWGYGTHGVDPLELLDALNRRVALAQRNNRARDLVASDAHALIVNNTQMSGLI